MEPDFESTTEAQVARVEMRSITSSQVLARPSEWLELLRRYGNVAPFFCLLSAHNKVCSNCFWTLRIQQSLLQVSKTRCGATSKIARDYQRVRWRCAPSLKHRLAMGATARAERDKLPSSRGR